MKILGHHSYYKSIDEHCSSCPFLKMLRVGVSIRKIFPNRLGGKRQLEEYIDKAFSMILLK